MAGFWGTGSTSLEDLEHNEGKVGKSKELGGGGSRGAST